MSKKNAGELDAHFDQLFDAGCIQTGCDTLENKEAADKFFRGYFQEIMKETRNNPCPGCPAFKGGQCEAYKVYHTLPEQERQLAAEKKKENATKPPGTAQYPGWSVKQIAQELGVSKSQVRRMKLQGLI